MLNIQNHFQNIYFPSTTISEYWTKQVTLVCTMNEKERERDILLKIELIFSIQDEADKLIFDSLLINPGYKYCCVEQISV